MEFENIKSFNNGDKNIKEIYNAGNKIWPVINTGPGPRILRAGDLQAGFYGEVPASEFITGDELCRLAGITQGGSQFSDEPWLKFSYLNETIFVAKKPIRYSISWDHINEKGCVFGEKTVETQGFKFKVTLLKAKTEGKQNDSSAYKGSINHNSMWNRLMGQVHEKAPSNWEYKENMENTLVNWGINYTDKDLHTHYDHGDGSYSWCQEYGESTSYRMGRGYDGVSGSGSNRTGNVYGYYGFRPALILIN